VNSLQNHPGVCWTERIILVLLLLYMGLHTLPRAWRSLITDFPNYYVAAQLAHEGDDTSRMYEWTWIEREKDNRSIDVRVIGLIPITPFSTLVIWPLTGMAPLAAKHVWILTNLLLLFPLAWFLQSMTGFGYRRIALAFALSVPLYRNLEYGQLYIFVLLLITAACWSYLRGFRALAGCLIALAAACKIFPILFFVFFLQRRDWRALTWGAITGIATVAISVAIFGWNVHRTYLHEILPWALRGGGLQPYLAGASISGVLHYLFLSEPQWNPHPWHYSPLCYALLLPAVQMLVVAPAILLIRREDVTRSRILLEWSALLTASLTDLRADAASYNFVLVILPVCVLATLLLQRKRYGCLAALLIAYFGIGFPLPIPHSMMGPAVLLYLPRLPLMFALLLGIYVLLWRNQSSLSASRDWTRYAWGAVMAVSVVFSSLSIFHLERAVRQEYAYRLPLKAQELLNREPRSAGTGVRYIAMTKDGYRLINDGRGVQSSDPVPRSPDDDDLSYDSGFGHVWVERSHGPRSQIVDVRDPSHTVIDDAEDPMVSSDGQSLAFLRDDRGRGQLMVRSGFQSNSPTEVALTQPRLNVYEASFKSPTEYAFSAADDHHPPQIYMRDATHTNAPLDLGEVRYPALSPDGRWMAYSRLDHGAWNLWLRDQGSGATRRIADVPCNQIEPSWEDDSKTILYGTDCGRSLWFTAIARRQVVP
jgi:Glycosyltransferase family 87/WD40-like Beta Propeller Repeat